MRSRRKPAGRPAGGIIGRPFPAAPDLPQPPTGCATILGFLGQVNFPDRHESSSARSEGGARPGESVHTVDARRAKTRHP